jgi:ribose transport system substrate-binding protein
MKCSVTSRRTLSTAAAVLTALLFTGCTVEGPNTNPAAGGATGGAASTGGAPLPIDQLCGNKPIKIAHVAGFGANSWRKITEAELKDELSACKNVTVDYSQADGDLQKYITAINSYSAQGYDAIVTYDDFGSQALSALSNAKKAGVVVVPYIADPGGKVGTDYDGYVAYDFKTEGDTMAKWLATQVPAGGNVIFTGGLPSGSPSTVELLKGIQSTNDQKGAFKIATPDPIASSWDPAYMQRAMSGVLTKFDKIDGWASDYGVADLGGLRAMVNASRPIPPLATSATDNEPELFKLPTFIDTANGKLPTCHKDLPPDADLSSALSQEKLKAVFK